LKGNEMTEENKAIIQAPVAALEIAGQIANKHAAAHVFAEYRSQNISDNTRRAQDLDLAVFADFLSRITKSSALNLAENPQAWQGVTHGLIKAFKQEQLTAGYAIGTINRRLATIKKYAGLAFQAGVIDATESALIKTVSSFSNKQGRNVDKGRKEAGLETRKSIEGKPQKKAENVVIPLADIVSLKHDHNISKPQGRRDAVLMCLLLDNGLRASEIVLLTVGSIDLKRGLMRFYRPKVNKTQTHDLSKDALNALREYIKQDAIGDKDAPLLKASKKSGELSDKAGLTTRSITRIVNQLGERIGLEGLSAHDCRHAWATNAAAAGTSPFVLQEAGGWSSLTMPRRYVDEQKVSNEGVKLPY
jgi:integrase